MERFVKYVSLSGDGVQAPISVIMTEDDSPKHNTKYRVFLRNDNDLGEFYGFYTNDKVAADKEFDRKLKQWSQGNINVLAEYNCVASLIIGG